MAIKIRALTQNKTVRVIRLCKYMAHSEPLFKNFNILKIDDLFKIVSLQILPQYQR